ncbi:hypothetical protein BUALT_Bualt15G0057300 [Buddleja alternifolia]|uniref:Phosphoglycerate mutase-like protein 1 n=1 Tax=Buddleja alternifolia TaxID=168488 RepID=A0AAV6WKN4_9LAMI|nr:hypothetical protein BUALT_Bualt15G0057300 [Buddleja alternifolia]
MRVESIHDGDRDPDKGHGSSDMDQSGHDSPHALASTPHGDFDKLKETFGLHTDDFMRMGNKAEMSDDDLCTELGDQESPETWRMAAHRVCFRYTAAKPFTWLVRHAQGIHNVAGEKDHKAYMSYEYFDAHLTQLGWQQVDNLRKHVHSSGLIKKLDLVITSPLLRTIQTAVGVFGGKGYTDGMNTLPLMVANAGNSGRAAISSLNCPPFLAVELCREHLGVHPCDKRSSISEYEQLFPAVDFSMIESDDDSLWEADVRETNEAVGTRGIKFLNWLFTRQEKEIAIVTHSGFLFHTLAAFGNDCHPIVKKEICTHFANCELRSMVIADRSMIGSDSSSTTNYPGKIPPGPDLPSAVADELNQEKDPHN